MSGAKHFQPITYQEFKGWMDAIGFREVQFSDAEEYVFEREVRCRLTADRQDRFKIRVMSSISKTTNVTRDIHEDALRVLLVDTLPEKNRIVLQWTVRRIATAQDNLLKRSREAWEYVSKHEEHHCSCGSLMVERKGRSNKFLGCTSYPACKQTKPIERS